MIDFLIPKQKDIWLFGAWKGVQYADNSRALFEYVCENKKSIRAIWLTSDDLVLKNIKNMGYEVYKFNSLDGIYYSIIAKVIIISVSYFDVSFWPYLFPWKLKIVQLWHGTPLKMIGENFILKSQELFLCFFRIYLGRSFDLLITASEINFALYSELFDIDKQFIKVTGQPRNDNLFLNPLKKKHKVILYLPTWREYDPNFDLFFQFGFDVTVIDDFLERNNLYLFIKFHSLESSKGSNLVNIIAQSRRIKLANFKDVYFILNNVDVLMTDYSSVYIDYLLLNRPIIFTPFDFDTYKEKRGFYYDYEKVTPGPKARSWDEVLECIDGVIKNDQFKERRTDIGRMFNSWNDKNNSSRVYSLVVNSVDNV